MIVDKQRKKIQSNTLPPGSNKIKDDPEQAVKKPINGTVPISLDSQMRTDPIEKIR
jgi:hypothetical protein